MIPDNYKWLETIGTLPKLLITALSYLGLKEFPGAANNPVIINMAKELGVDNIYKDDSTQAWCALIMCYWCKIAGKPMNFKGYDVLRAASFKDWGNPVPRGEEKLGDIMVFKRPEGHHVFINTGESDHTFHGIGGNQSNSVSFTEIDKNRLVACRRFYATMPPASVKKYLIDSSGHVSTNEA